MHHDDQVLLGEHKWNSATETKWTVRRNVAKVRSFTVCLLNYMLRESVIAGENIMKLCKGSTFYICSE